MNEIIPIMLRMTSAISIIASILLQLHCAVRVYGLTDKQCATLDNTTLSSLSEEVVKTADSLLVPHRFARSASGFLKIVQDESDGIEDGGVTNPLGAYSVFLFKSSDIFPPSACELPTYQGISVCGSGVASSFFLGPADAIAFVGCSPSPMRYFSYDMDILMRLTAEYPFYPAQNFGDTINHRTINTTGDTPFMQPISVIFTADGAAASDVSKAYQHAGIASEAINVRQVSSSIVNLWDRSDNKTWQQAAPDLLDMINRISVPDPDATDDWEQYKNTVWPVRFYFAYDDQKAEEPLDPPIKSRYSPAVVNEYIEQGESLAQLEAAVTASFLARDGATFSHKLTLNQTVFGYYDDWEQVLANENNDSFILPDRDAIYEFPNCPGDECLYSSMMAGTYYMNEIRSARFYILLLLV